NPLNQNADQVAALEAEIDAVWADLQFQRGNAAEAVRHAERAWARLPLSAPHALGVAGQVLGLAQRVCGHPEGIEELLASDRALALEGQPGGTLRLQYALAAAQLADGQLHRAEQTACRLVSGSRAQQLEPVEASAHQILGRIYYDRDDLVAAEEH